MGVVEYLPAPGGASPSDAGVFGGGIFFFFFVLFGIRLLSWRGGIGVR